MGLLQDIIEMYADESFLIADGFDEAIIGVEEDSMRIVYSVPRCLGILIRDEELNLTDAIEHFEFNVKGSYMGEKTPIFVETLEEL